LFLKALLTFSIGLSDSQFPQKLGAGRRQV